MILTDSMKSKFIDFKHKILSMTSDPEAKPIMASPLGVTIFKGIDQSIIKRIKGRKRVDAITNRFGIR